MGMVIREFEDRDAERVAEIMYESFRTVYDDPKKVTRRPPAYWIARSHAEDSDRTVTSFVAEVDGTVAGYLNVTALKNFGLGILEVIGVDPKIFAKGIGQALFAEAEKFWKSLKMRKIYTCTSHTNLRAQAFYKKAGFVEEGRLKSHFHSGIDEIQLSKFYE